jgi:hypothetical protein
MAEESVRDLVRHVRRVLQEKGSIGAFLLSELDASISRGVNELARDDHEKTLPAQVIGRRTPTEEELLGILLSALETYLLTLPTVADSLRSYLREHYKVEHIEITLDPSLLVDELNETGRVRLDMIVPRTADEKAVTALEQLREIAAEAKRGWN